jgi:hypothetical protein
MLFMTPTITQNTHMISIKLPQMLSLCFVSSKVKEVIVLYIKNWKL